MANLIFRGSGRAAASARKAPPRTLYRLQVLLRLEQAVVVEALEVARRVPERVVAELHQVRPQLFRRSRQCKRGRQKNPGE